MNKRLIKIEVISGTDTKFAGRLKNGLLLFSDGLLSV